MSLHHYPSNVAFKYGNVDAYSSVETADSHKLIEMLFNGVLQRLSAAKGHMHNNEISKKGISISKAINILDGLRTSLNKEEGGHIADNLDNLYDYMQRRLIAANFSNDSEIVDEVIFLIIEIKEGWSAIANIDN